MELPVRNWVFSSQKVDVFLPYVVETELYNPLKTNWKESPAILFYVPDGHTKEMPKSGSKHKETKAVEKAEKPLSNKQKKKLAEQAKQSAAQPAAPATGGGDLAIWEKVTAQGNKIRELKSKKASKDEIMKEVESLKTLKAEYKKATGQEYDANKKPAGGAQQPAAVASNTGDLAIWEKVTAQGNKIRELKSKKARFRIIFESMYSFSLLIVGFC